MKIENLSQIPNDDTAYIKTYNIQVFSKQSYIQIIPPYCIEIV